MSLEAGDGKLKIINSAGIETLDTDKKSLVLFPFVEGSFVVSGRAVHLDNGAGLQEIRHLIGPVNPEMKVVLGGIKITGWDIYNDTEFMSFGGSVLLGSNAQKPFYGVTYWYKISAEFMDDNLYMVSTTYISPVYGSGGIAFTIPSVTVDYRLAVGTFN